MAGFFGLEWSNNATLELIIEENGFNNSLAGYKNCPNSMSWRNTGGQNATLEWTGIYLKDATKRLQALVKDFDWTISDTYAAQTMCPYETVRVPTSHEIVSLIMRCRLHMATQNSAPCSPTPNGNHSSTHRISTSLALRHFNRPLAELLGLATFKKPSRDSRTIP